MTGDRGQGSGVRKGWCGTALAWLALIGFLAGFGALVSVGLACAPWNVAWHEATGGGPACPLHPEKATDA